jgi:hypothetical protein
MKSISKTFPVVLVSFFFLSASIWEGSAAIAPPSILPETGFYAATNSFPQNTVILVINLENEKNVEVTVRASLNNPSLLILLSKEAADAISLSNQYTGRVRVMQSSDAPLAFSERGERVETPSNLDHNPTTPAAVPETTPVETIPEEEATPPSSAVEEEEATPPPSVVEETDEADSLDNTELALVPTEERPPEGEVVVPEGPEVAPIEKVENPDEAPPTDSKSPEDYFSVPVISVMETGKFYLQLMSFRKPELVESAIGEIKKIENTDKLVIQVAELDGLPIYRILLGPIERAESQTLLQTFNKIGYADAFVWTGR